MTESQPWSPSEDSSPTTSTESKRRVTRACHRCRLKKCKCDGSSPCKRCKVDNAICAYGMHKKSDKTVYGKGYVEMLEWQHTQLIKGIGEMHRMLVKANSWPGPNLEPSEQNASQPLTHEILEALGVLQSSSKDQGEEALFERQAFENFIPGAGVMYNDAHQAPTAHSLFSPPSPMINHYAEPRRLSLIERRRFKHGVYDTEMEQYNLGLPYLPTLLPSINGELPLSADVSYPVQQRPLLPDQFVNTLAYDAILDLGDNVPGEPEMMHIDWKCMERTLDPTQPLVPPTQTV